MPNTERLSDGFFVVGMKDFEYDLRTKDVLIGCQGTCGSGTYPVA